MPVKLHQWLKSGLFLNWCLFRGVILAALFGFVFAEFAVSAAVAETRINPDSQIDALYMVDSPSEVSSTPTILFDFNEKLRSGHPSVWTWALLPVALAPLFLLGLWTKRFLADQEASRWTWSELITLMISIGYSAVMITTVFYDCFSSWVDPDDLRNLLGAFALTHGEYFPVEGPAIHSNSLFLGPLNYMGLGVFALIFENHLIFSMLSLCAVIATQVVGAAFLRRKLNSTTSLVWIVIVPVHLTLMTVVDNTSNRFLAVPLGVLLIWVLQDAFRRRISTHLPLAFLLAGLAVQFYAANVLWVIAIVWLMVVFGLRVNAGSRVAGCFAFMLPQVFTILMLFLDLVAGRQIIRGDISWSPMWLVAGVLAVAAAIAVTVAARMALRRHNRSARIGESEIAMVAVFFVLDLCFIVALSIAGVMQSKYVTFALPSTYLVFAATVGLFLKYIGDRYPWWKNHLAGLVAACGVAGMSAVIAFNVDVNSRTLSRLFNPATAVGSHLTDFLRKAGVVTRTDYLENTHSLYELTLGLPWYPLFQLDSDRYGGQSRPPKQILFMPGALCEGRPEVQDDWNGTAEALCELKLDVVAYDSRLNYGGQQASIAYPGERPTEVLKNRAFGPAPSTWSETVTERALRQTGLNDDERIMLEKRIRDRNSVPSVYRHKDATLRLRTPVAAGNPRVMAVIVSTDCRSRTSFDQKPMNIVGHLAYSDEFEDGSGFRVEVYELGAEAGVVEVEVALSDCDMQLLDVIDPPVGAGSFIQFLGRYGYRLEAAEGLNRLDRAF